MLNYWVVSIYNFDYCWHFWACWAIANIAWLILLFLRSRRNSHHCLALPIIAKLLSSLHNCLTIAVISEHVEQSLAMFGSSLSFWGHWEISTIAWLFLSFLSPLSKFHPCFAFPPFLTSMTDLDYYLALPIMIERFLHCFAFTTIATSAIAWLLLSLLGSLRKVQHCLAPSTICGAVPINALFLQWSISTIAWLSLSFYSFSFIALLSPPLQFLPLLGYLAGCWALPIIAEHIKKCSALSTTEGLTEQFPSLRTSSYHCCACWGVPITAKHNSHDCQVHAC